MPLPYEQNKVYIYKWRTNNLDKSRAIIRKSKAKRDAWLKVSKLYMAILLE